MTIEKKSHFEGLPTRSDWERGDFINAGEYEYIIKTNHLLFTRPFRRTPGWEIAFGTTSRTWATTNEDRTTDLDQWTGVSRPIRFVTSDSSKLAVGLAARLKECEARVSVYSLYWDTGTRSQNRSLLGTVKASHSGTSFASVRNGSTFSVSNAENSDSDPSILEFELEARTTGSSGEMHRWVVDDGVISTVDIPIWQ